MRERGERGGFLNVEVLGGTDKVRSLVRKLGLVALAGRWRDREGWRCLGGNALMARVWMRRSNTGVSLSSTAMFAENQPIWRSVFSGFLCCLSLGACTWLCHAVIGEYALGEHSDVGRTDIEEKSKVSRAFSGSPGSLAHSSRSPISPEKSLFPNTENSFSCGGPSLI